jgi:hypothetical protein
MGIILRPVFCLKHDVSEAAFCVNLQVESTQVGPIERISRHRLNTDTESSLRNVVVLNKRGESI